MSYDPTDCELGICGPCEACQEQMKIEDEIRLGEGEFAGEDTRGDFIELGDSIPEPGDLADGLDYEEGDLSMTKPVTEKTPIGTIDITPSWVAVVTIYLDVLTDSGAGTHAKAMAREEILRVAKLADLYVKARKRDE